MDSQTAQLLSIYLPPEIVAEIEDHLIQLCKRENAQHCADLIRRYVKYEADDDEVFIKIEGSTAMIFESCSCGEVISFQISKSYLTAVTHSPCDYERWTLWTDSKEDITINGRLLRCLQKS